MFSISINSQAKIEFNGSNVNYYKTCNQLSFHFVNDTSLFYSHDLKIVNKNAYY